MARPIQKLILILIAALIPSAGSSMELDRIIAVVDQDVVMRSELDSQIRRVREQLRQQGTALPPTSVLERQIMDRIILQKIQIQKAAEVGVEVPEERLEAAIQDIAGKNKLSIDQFKEILQSDGYQFSEFREQIRDEIMIASLRRQEVDRRVQVSENEIENFISNEFSQGASELEFRVGHILISIPANASNDEQRTARERADSTIEQLRGGANFGDLAIAVSDGQNAIEKGDLGWRRADQVPSLFSSTVREMNVDDTSDIITSPSGYHIIQLTDRRSGEEVLVEQTSARHILVSPGELVTEEDAVLRINQLKIRLDGGDEFGNLARTNSDDRGSAVEGGDLGWVSKGQMVPEFEDVMLFTEIGEISEPFRSEFGWHILQVLDRRSYDGSEDVKRSKARSAISRRKTDEKYQSWLRRLRDEAYVEYRDNAP
ncbi:MAG: peptidyl-prolyl cis-trans isomerase SurA [Gammaproteobacteria bacterium]|jgi:peptidyl-prolyl cis-trans isomerase SurA